ncbi:MAG TPA: apolipoprotein N-acyltransferase [Acidimicrobiia bacterium]|nr:apolipoprotein N-acyltransferase [Acidimicrobiia bacterium]
MSRIGRTLRDRAVQRRLGAAVLAGVLLALAFPAFDLGLLAFVALVPLIWAWRDATPWRGALYGFAFGVVFAGILMYWLWYFGIVAIVPLVAGWGAFAALTGYLVGCLNRAELRSPWLIAAAWVVPEALRGRWPFGGLPWGDLGVGLHDFPPARALASWGGVALVSFVIVVVNGYLVDLAVAVGTHARRSVAFAGAGIAVVVAVVAVADAARYQTNPSGTLRVATLQGNDQDRYLTTQEKAAGYLTQHHFALAGRLRGRYDLIVFPESSLDNFSPESNPNLRSRLVAVGNAHGADVLANAAVPAPNGREFNQNLLYTLNGRLAGTYSKEHLVPFGEYVPFRSLVDWTGIVDRIPYDYTPGNERTIFRVKGHRLATVICFESAFGPLVRDFVARGAEVVVVSTNNRSYRRSANSAQHIAQTQMRAAETGRPFVQASISGMSAVVDADGHVRNKTKLFKQALVTDTVTTTTGETPYVRFGEWVVVASALLLLGAAIASRLRRPPATFPKLPAAEREPVGSGRMS